MKLSVVIVNYNVKYFLEQCLHSVAKAAQGIDCEVFVVDNNSVDGSCAMVAEKFPQVKLIENKRNTGFAVANNQAIRQSTGEYVLLLNPDTLIEEDTFSKTLKFMDEHPDAGGLGVKMIDGKGNYLPESKRGFPSPMVAFYKIFGLSSLFPKSRRFNQYYMGHLSKDAINEVDVLAGAFMLLRRSALDKVGLLDEDFFMYGEDIDLSYRIIQGGYKNYYFPETRIIHYKGESTKKGSVNYVRMFYNAMSIFAQKNLSARNAAIFSFLINCAIYFRAFLAIVSRFVKRIALPVADIAIMYAGMVLLGTKWSAYIFEGRTFPTTFFTIVAPIYVLIWTLSIYYSDGYESKAKPLSVARGIVAGTLVILIGYALLPENMRFSRAMIMFGTMFSLLTINVFRIGVSRLFPNRFQFDMGRKSHIAVVGTQAEADRVVAVLDQSSLKYQYAGFINPDGTANRKAIGDISQISEIVKINKIDELIFCSADMTAQQIIGQMLQLDGDEVHFKIAPPESLSIIGSNSIDTAGDLYTVNFNTIVKPQNVRNKRTFDILSSVLLLAVSPVLWFVSGRPLRLYRNIFSVLVGRCSWVGFSGKSQNPALPKIKRGVLSLSLIRYGADATPEQCEKTDLFYAKDYQLRNDLAIMARGVRHLSI
ncbi:MAG: glycosyltransferase [Salinivirgaceae bacterium]|nr:glycosyltransferase [Salinivirgaceae bacterium]